MKINTINDPLPTSLDLGSSTNTIQMALALLNADTTIDCVLVLDFKGNILWKSQAFQDRFSAPLNATESLCDYVQEFLESTWYEAILDLSRKQGYHQIYVHIQGHKHLMNLLVNDNAVIAVFDENAVDEKAEENKHQVLDSYEEVIKKLPRLSLDSSLYFIVLTVRNIEDIAFVRGQKHVSKIFREFSKLLKKHLSEKIDLYHLSSLEIGAVIPTNLSLKDVILRFNHLMNLIDLEVMVEDMHYHIQVHCGISKMRSGQTFEDVIKDARFAKDIAISQNTLIESYSEDEVMRHIETITMSDRFLNALHSDKLHVEYQELMRHDNTVWGYEALIRWCDGIGGRVSADKIIEFAERSGTMVRLGYWIIRRVFEEYVSTLSVINPGSVVTINLSLEQFKDKHLAENIFALVQEYGINPPNVMFEITESHAFKSIHEVKGVLETLRSHGFMVALDDFGVGYSTIQTLLELPLNVVKLDRYLISSISEKPRNIAVLKSIVGLAKELGYYIVAEGIENQIDEAMIKKFPIDLYQGYYFSKPKIAKSLEPQSN